MLAIVGSNYNEAYYRMLDQHISDVLFQIETWIALQTEIKQQQNEAIHKAGHRK